ncbi:MAG: hypothetical protein WD875_06000, partial [Pirellulales bacterium]
MATSGFTLGLRQAKAGFFDRPAVQNATDRATNRNLSRFSGGGQTVEEYRVRDLDGMLFVNS